MKNFKILKSYEHYRSIADGQSHHSFNHSQRGYLNSAFPTNLVNSRPGKKKKKLNKKFKSET